MKPMLAAKLDSIENVPYPVLATPKIDGIRCLSFSGIGYSRSMKLIPNRHIQHTLASGLPNDVLDGELVLANHSFNDIQSAVMTATGAPDFRYMVFDCVTPNDTVTPYFLRIEHLKNLNLPWWVHKVLPEAVHNPEELSAYEIKCLSEGYEGVMLRTFGSPYKHGRSTLREFGLVKMKRFLDAEAIAIDFVELMHNTNPAFIGELGQTKRKSDKEGQVPGNMLGAIVVQDVESGLVFEIGTGFTQLERVMIWKLRHEYAGKQLTYKYQPHGMKDLPRSPVFLRWREKGL